MLGEPLALSEANGAAKHPGGGAGMLNADSSLRRSGRNEVNYVMWASHILDIYYHIW